MTDTIKRHSRLTFIKQPLPEPTETLLDLARGLADFMAGRADYENTQFTDRQIITATLSNMVLARKAEISAADAKRGFTCAHA